MASIRFETYDDVGVYRKSVVQVTLLVLLSCLSGARPSTVPLTLGPRIEVSVLAPTVFGVTVLTWMFTALRLKVRPCARRPIVVPDEVQEVTCRPPPLFVTDETPSIVFRLVVVTRGVVSRASLNSEKMPSLQV